MDSLLAWYQRKISAYDLQVWERAVELTEQNGISSTSKTPSSPKEELIDVDLVRGSMFSKNKPQYSWTFVTCIGMLRVFFFPVFFTWWSQQTSKRLSIVLLFLYFLNWTTFYIYRYASKDEVKNIQQYELLMPLINALVIGGLHCQVVSTNFKPKDNTKDRRGNTKWRTLSSVLLEPVASGSHLKTMSFVESALAGNLKPKPNEASGDEPKLTKSYLDNAISSKKEEINTQEKQKCNKKKNSSASYWEDLHSSDSCTSISSDEDSDEDPCEDVEKKKNDRKLSATALLPCSSPGRKYIAVRIWEGGVCKKVQASLLDIGGAIMTKAKNCPVSVELFGILSCFSTSVAFLPILFRFINQEQTKSALYFDIFCLALGDPKGRWKPLVIITSLTLQRFVITWLFIFILCVAYRTYKQRFLFSKYFSHLTSSRKARKSDIPHFRLHKVENVRLWLSLRSYLRRRGPQRSVDVIVSTSFMLMLGFICFITLQLLQSPDIFMSSLICWEATLWLLVVAVFILKFITLGVRTNQKYRNVSVLIIEQINLYLQMQEKPQKKDELQRANAVLNLATKLMKEIERPFNIHGLAMNPLLYNITRVVVLSAFSGVISEILGFKLKIWKIKA